jgi:hypothetical protein
MRICAATSSAGLSLSNSPSSKLLMPTEPDMDIFECLKAIEPPEWSSFADHAFVRQIETAIPRLSVTDVALTSSGDGWSRSCGAGCTCDALRLRESSEIRGR